MNAELDGLVCSGLRKGKQFTYALLQKRVPPAKTRTREEAMAELVKRYFFTRGPATLQDFTWWSGLTLKDAREGKEVKSQLTRSADAVVDSGVKKTVYVDKGDGVFEPRRVETGRRAGGQVEITRGLLPGEKIVVSGTFLLDSESRMKAVSAGVFDAQTDPVCGMEVDQKKAAAAGRSAVHEGRTYYFCAEDCKRQFDAEPAKFAGK